MAVNLSKGQRVDLTKGPNGLKRATMGLGWDTNRYDGKQPFDLDLVMFMCGSNGKCLGEKYMIFYGNLKDPEESVIHSGDNRTGAGDGDDESATIDFTKISESVEKIVVAVTIFEATVRDQNFGLVDNAYVRLVNMENPDDEKRFDLAEEYGEQTSLIFVEFYRYNGEWKLKAVGDGYVKELADLCREYGLEVADA